MKYSSLVLVFLAGVSIIGLSGCMATSREIAGLRDDMHEMQLKLNELQRNQADISSKMDTISTGMGPLTSELQETQNRMSLLGQRLDDVEANISQRVNRLSENISSSSMASSPSPSEIYRIAYSDFSRGKYDLALVGFASYLEKFPQGELASQAQYYTGECYFAQSNWDKAIAEFARVEKDYPQSNSVVPARLKQGLCLELMGKVREARDMFKSLVKDFPNAPEAYTAREKLK